MSALAGAFLSQNPETAEPFLSLNETWSTDGATSTASEPITHHSHTNTGAIAGGVVGGVAVLAAFVFGLLWLYRRRKREAASTVEATSTQETPPSDPGMQTSGLKELPRMLPTSPCSIDIRLLTNAYRVMELVAYDAFVSQHSSAEKWRVVTATA